MGYNTKPSSKAKKANQLALKSGYGMDGLTAFDSKKKNSVGREGSSESNYVYNYGIQDYSIQFVDGNGQAISDDQLYGKSYYDPLYLEPMQYTYEFKPSGQDGIVGELVVKEPAQKQEPEVKQQKSVYDDEELGELATSSDEYSDEQIETDDFEDVYITVDLSEDMKKVKKASNIEAKMGYAVPSSNIVVLPTKAGLLQHLEPEQTLVIEEPGQQSASAYPGGSGYQQNYHNFGNQVTSQTQYGNYDNQVINRGYYGNQGNQIANAAAYGSYSNQYQLPPKTTVASSHMAAEGSKMMNLPQKNQNYEYNDKVDSTPEVEDPFYFPPHLGKSYDHLKWCYIISYPNWNIVSIQVVN